MQALRTLLFTVLATLPISHAVCAQQSYPNRPIRLIVPYPAGGATDVVARIVVEKMSDELGQQIFVDNRPGAGTMIGATAVARSAPDGYTLLLGDTGTYALNPTLYDKQLTYDPAKDFAPISRTGRVPLILVANSNVIKVNAVQELIATAKKEPGKIDYGAPGPGSPIHLAMELFKQRVDINVNPIPYKGGADALTDLLGGRIATQGQNITEVDFRHSNTVPAPHGNIKITQHATKMCLHHRCPDGSERCASQPSWFSRPQIFAVRS